LEIGEMRLAPLNQARAKPLGFTRWIKSWGVRSSKRATKFHPPHEPRSSGRESAPFGQSRLTSAATVQAFNARIVSEYSLPRGGGRGEGEGKLEKLRCSQKRSAFTLIELVIVIVIIGIAAAVIVPEMKGGYQDALLRSTSRELVNVFSIASSRAVSLNQLHRVRIEAGTGRYVIERRTRETVQGDEYKALDDVSEAEGTLDKRISVRVHTLDDSPAAPASETSQTRADIDSISFYSDGTADSAELLLRDKQGYRMALRINPITAHVKIMELGRE
jgi:type II secretion system protein H